MATFKQNNITTSADIIKRQRQKSIIYLEGESDKKVFENYWFLDFLEKVTFATVPETKGCAAVVNKVGTDRQNGLPAFGLVDRDKLMADRKWGLLRELDDAKFESGRPYPEVKVTNRWELESYLIDPVIVENYVAAAEGGRKTKPLSVLETEYLAHADALVPVSALNQTLHMHGETAVGDGYTKVGEDRVAVDKRIREEKLKTNKSLENDYDATLPFVDAFCGGVTESPRQRLEGFLRILNGKAMLDRLKKSAKIQHDIVFHLARDIKQANRIPDELTTFVQSCCS